MVSFALSPETRLAASATAVLQRGKASGLSAKDTPPLITILFLASCILFCFCYNLGISNI